MSVDSSSAITTKDQILVIDDDHDLTMLLESLLQKVGYRTVTAETGHDGLRLFYNQRPNLVILDIRLPGMDGWKVCERIRELSDVPIMLLTAQAEANDRIRGFGLGADDYVAKPFELRELLARIRALLRRSNHQSLEGKRFAVFDNGELHVNFDSHDVLVRGQPVHLTRREFLVLSYLIENQGRVLTPQQLLRQVWGPEFTDEVGYVKLYIRYLRIKIEETPSSPRIILTQRGVGYRFARAEDQQYSSPRGVSSEQNI
ncbi:MAG: response regulator transcription factor [Chloroflexi bacterium]|nr:response regulator transcription factor [Chloroflexota bacterium]